MVNIINNPKQEFSVKCSKSEVITKLKYLKDLSIKKKKDGSIKELKIDDIVGQISLISKPLYSGLIDLGLSSTITILEKNSEECLISVEVGRVFGAISNESELKEAQDYIKYLITMISELLQSDNIDELIKNTTKESNNGCLLGMLVGATSFIVIIMLMSMIL